MILINLYLFLKPKRDGGFEEAKDRIIELLELKTEEDCKRIRELIKSEREKQRKTKPIRNWIEEERPREMLIKQGAESISLAKLSAIILRTGSEGVSAEDLARRLLNHFGRLRAIDSAHITDLQIIVPPFSITSITFFLFLFKDFTSSSSHHPFLLSSPR